jgi:hypothetical protein
LILYFLKKIEMFHIKAYKLSVYPLLVRISLLGKAAEPSGNPHLLNHGFLCKQSRQAER